MNSPNIFIIVLDTARRSNAYNVDIMPNLADIANDENTIQYENATTSAPWTLPSHASLFTGQLTSDHGTHANARQFSPSVPTLASWLQKQGYNTRAYSNNVWINPEFGFGTGFNYFDKSWLLFNEGVDIGNIAKEYNTTQEQITQLSKSLTIKTAPKTVFNAIYVRFFRKKFDKGAKITTWKIKKWLQNRDHSSPFFTFVNFLEPHGPYNPPKTHVKQHLPEDVSYRDAMSIDQDPWKYIADPTSLNKQELDLLERIYNGELSYIDKYVRKIYEFLNRSGDLENTIFVVCGDHGENIGDHDLMDHQYSVHDTLLRIPLVIRYPNSIYDAYPNIDSENERLIELRDLYASLIDAATPDENKPFKDLEDHQSSHSILRSPSRHHTVAEYLTPQPSIDALQTRSNIDRGAFEKYDRGLRTIRTANWKYIEGTDDSEFLYNIAKDERENVNYAKDQPNRLEKMAEQLNTIYGPQLPPGEDHCSNPTEKPDYISSDVQNRLEELGYL
ncbi:sulfatase-like hydrolase/transferase [Halalkalicoccus salilacus]|uniref:sulfatase-like hydrolase/transferase n=1 Tax=Halalkalicoccus TaxID=332246 RepID=UPI002F9647C1